MSTPPAPERLVAIAGDLVCGLASPFPPQPFVGRLGDPALEAAAMVNAAVLTSAGVAPPRTPRMTIQGRPIATVDMDATSLVDGSKSTTLPTPSLTRLAGQPLTRQQDPSQVTPSSSIVVFAGTQNLMSVGPGVAASEATAAEAGRGRPPARRSFEPGSGAAAMLSRCSPGRRSQLAPPHLAVLVGDPVNVATGAVVSTAQDFCSVAPPIKFIRNYASNLSGRAGPLGHGWSHNFDQALWLEPGRVVLRDEHGRELEFDCLDLPGQVARAGDTLTDATGQLRLLCQGQLRWQLHDQGRIRQFGPIPGEDASLRDIGLARLVRIVREHELTHELHYDGSARLQEVRVGGRSMLSFRWNPAGQLASLWTELGPRLHRHTSFEYDESGDLVRVVDAAGARHSYEYVAHLLVRESDADGASFYYGYDGCSETARCIRTWGAGGYLDRTLEYDGGTVRVSDGAGSMTQYRVSPVGLITAVVDPLGATTRYRYDDALRLVEVECADGGKTTDTYDEQGRLTRRKGPGGQAWSMSYDAKGRLIEGTDRQGGRWQYSYDGEGRLTRVQDPLGHTTRLEYEGGRLRGIVDALGQTTEVSVDPYDNPTLVRTPAGQPVAFEYDAFGQLETAAAPEAGRFHCSYDHANRVVALASPAESLAFARSPAGWVSQIRRGQTQIKISRNLFGDVERATSDEFDVRYGRDREGRIVRVARGDQPGLALTRDARGQVTRWQWGEESGQWIHRDVKSGRPERIVDADGSGWRLTWDEAGRLAAFAGPGGATCELTYRDDGLLVGARNQTAKLRFDRDVRGAVVSQACDDVTIETSSCDHRGRRRGLDVDDALRVSYLRNATGQVERVAVVCDDAVFDLAVRGAASGANLALPLRRSSTPDEQVIPDRALTASSQAGRSGEIVGRSWDGLHRPLTDDDGQALLWDEDQLLRRGNRWCLAHPDAAVPMAELGPEGLQAPGPGGRSMPAPNDHIHRLCFPALVTDQAWPTPHRLIRNQFAYRVWDPEVRPFAGLRPWDPENWGPQLEGPSNPEARLDQASLHVLLGGDFPRQGLRLNEHR